MDNNLNEDRFKEELKNRTRKELREDIVIIIVSTITSLIVACIFN